MTNPAHCRLMPHNPHESLWIPMLTRPLQSSLPAQNIILCIFWIFWFRIDKKKHIFIGAVRTWMDRNGPKFSGMDKRWPDKLFTDPNRDDHMGDRWPFEIVPKRSRANSSVRGSLVETVYQGNVKIPIETHQEPIIFPFWNNSFLFIVSTLEIRKWSKKWSKVFVSLKKFLKVQFPTLN